MITEEKKAQLLVRMAELQIQEKDLVEKFILGSGKGGQKLHKTSSCVYLQHLPSGIEVKCQRTRSREDNRYFARRELCEKFASTLLGIKSKKELEAEKVRKQKQRRKRRRLDS